MHSAKVFDIVWFDSLGAKSSSILLHAEDCDILVDPGAAAMQPSYPLSSREKQELRRRALKKIAKLLSDKRLRVVIISHYHYDHYPRPGDEIVSIDLLSGKHIIAKSPNEFINESQWKRAREFYEALGARLGTDNIYTEPLERDYVDPLEELKKASSRRFPGYDERRRELLNRGRQWFWRLRRLWSRGPWVREIDDIETGTRIIWGDGRRLEVCGAKLEFTKPLFHGVEYDRTGWVIGFRARIRGRELFYTSDVMGPIIEDYVDIITRSKLDILILDGPPTYLYPYMLNRINLERAIENAIAIIDAEPSLVIYDHHLLREKKWRQRVERVFKHAMRRGVALMTAAEYLGLKPLIDLL